MIGRRRVIGLVTARAGSKGVPGKNVRPLGGKPLIAWTIGCAQATPEIDRIVVSTDGEQIAKVSRELGAEVIERPAELATDEARSVDVARQVAEQLRTQGEDAELMVLLQPTSPFRTPADIQAALTMLDEQGLDCVVSYAEAATNPHLAVRLDDGAPKPFVEGADFRARRQDLPPAYEPNGAVYAFVIGALGADEAGLPFGNAGGFVMDRERSLDLDDELDFEIAETLVSRGSNRPDRE